MKEIRAMTSIKVNYMTQFKPRTIMFLLVLYIQKVAFLKYYLKLFVYTRTSTNQWRIQE